MNRKILRNVILGLVILSFFQLFIMTSMQSDNLSIPTPDRLTNAQDANEDAIVWLWTDTNVGVDFRLAVVVIALILLIATMATLYMHFYMEEET